MDRPVLREPTARSRSARQSGQRGPRPFCAGRHGRHSPIRVGRIPGERATVASATQRKDTRIPEDLPSRRPPSIPSIPAAPRPVGPGRQGRAGPPAHREAAAAARCGQCRRPCAASLSPGPVHAGLVAKRPSLDALPGRCAGGGPAIDSHCERPWPYRPPATGCDGPTAAGPQHARARGGPPILPGLGLLAGASTAALVSSALALPLPPPPHCPLPHLAPAASGPPPPAPARLGGREAPDGREAPGAASLPTRSPRPWGGQPALFLPAAA